MGPIASMHDRACELYQQLVGIMQVRDAAGLAEDDCGPALARAVYGSEHFDHHHVKYQKFYKPRYLKQVRNEIDKIYAFPFGLPGGWSAERKVHLIAHS
jgi:hypothetical protein